MSSYPLSTGCSLACQASAISLVCSRIFSIISGRNSGGTSRSKVPICHAAASTPGCGPRRMESVGTANTSQILHNVVITEDKKGRWDKTPAITDVIKKAEKSLGDNGRVLVRESGTEPLLRVMIEGVDDAAVNFWVNEIVSVVEKELCDNADTNA